jgi:hypothetical protein
MQQGRESQVHSYQLGMALLLSQPESVDRYLLDGWAGPEATHRWTNGNRARLKLSLDGYRGQDVLFQIWCTPFLPRARFSNQQVVLWVNSKRIATWLVDKEACYESLIPHYVIEDGVADVVIDISNPISPFECGLSDDKRSLGLLVREIRLSAPTLNWMGTGQDPIGSVFHRSGYFVRAIRKDALSTVKMLRDSGVYEQLTKLNLIPHHDFVQIDHPKYELVARTKGSPWYVAANNYTLDCLLDAALAWVAISEFLVNSPLPKLHVLIDGHYGNFALFEGSRPRWVDTGSIAQPQDWFGVEQFVRCFINPLWAIASAPTRRVEIRNKIAQQPDGFSDADVLLFSESLPDTGLKSLEIRDCKQKATQNLVLRRLKRILDDLRLGDVSNFWSNYRSFAELEAAWAGTYALQHPDSRFRTIANLVEECNAESFIDIGSNDGLFSLLCARSGKVGIAVDTDDHSLNKLYEFLRVHPNAPVTVSYGGFSEMPYVADLVLCLALTHHLFLSQGLTFEEISRKLANSCTKYAITEHMPNGLGGTSDIAGDYPNPLPEAYSLEHFLGALRKNFIDVRVVEYHREHAPSKRTLIFCEGPKLA